MYTFLLDNKLFLAPIGNNPQVCVLLKSTLNSLLTIIKKVIDIGTGTGIWAM